MRSRKSGCCRRFLSRRKLNNTIIRLQLMTTRLCIKRLSPFCEQRAVLLQVHSCSIYGNIARVSTRQITDHWQSTYRHLPHRSKLASRKHITLVHDRGAMADTSSTDRRGGGGRSDEVSSLRLPRMHLLESSRTAVSMTHLSCQLQELFMLAATMRAEFVQDRLVKDR